MLGKVVRDATPQILIWWRERKERERKEREDQPAGR